METTNMIDTRNTAIALCKTLDEQIRNDASIDTVNETLESINKSLVAYANMADTAILNAIKDSPNPMHKACIDMSYDVIALKENKETNTHEIVYKKKPIDLEKVDKYCHGIGHDRDWQLMLESFNYRLAMRMAGDIGASNLGSLKDTYAIRKIAQEYDIGKNPVSNNNMLATLRKVIAAMLGDEYASKVLNHDVKFLISTYGTLSKKAYATLKLADHKAFRTIVQNMCHKILTDSAYSVEFKAKKA